MTAEAYREVEFIPLDWVDRALWWPGLQVYSRPVKIPVDVACPQRRHSDRVYTDVTNVADIERLLKVIFCPNEGRTEERINAQLDAIEEITGML